MTYSARMQRQYSQKLQPSVQQITPFLAWWGVVVVCAIVAGGIGISISTYKATSSSESDDLDVSFRQAAKDAYDGIASQLSRTVSSISNLRMVSYANENFTANQFYGAVDLLSKPAVIVAIAYIPQIPQANKAEFEARVRAENTDALSMPLYNTFRVVDYNATKRQFVPAAPRSLYYPILYLWPRPTPSNTTLIGFDIGTAVLSFGDSPRAIKTGVPVLLTGVRVLTDPAQRGILFYVPAYRSYPPQANESGRLEQGTGIFAASAKLTLLIDGARSNADPVQIFVFDLSAVEGKQLLYSEPGVTNVQNASNVQPVHGLIFRQAVDAVDRMWLVIIVPKESLVNESVTSKPKLFAGLVGLAFILLLALAVFSIRQIVRTRMQSESSDRKRRFLSEMVGYVNHEIRNPLNGIVGLVEHATETTQGCLRSANPDKELIKAILFDLKDTGNMCDLMAHIVNDVLDIRKLEDGKLTVNHEPVRLRRVLGDVFAIVQPKLSEKASLRLVLEPFDHTLTFLGDAARVKQVLLNLVTNAIKFSASGEIHVSASVVPGGPSLPSGRNFVSQQGQQHISVAMASQTMQCLRFEVRDTGRGVEDDKKALLFKPFSQIEGSPRHQGSGLGLYLCLMLVELMGGRIDFESTYGVGSSFWFEIPLLHPTESDTDSDDHGSNFANAGSGVDGFNTSPWTRALQISSTVPKEDGDTVEIELVEVEPAGASVYPSIGELAGESATQLKPRAKAPYERERTLSADDATRGVAFAETSTAASSGDGLTPDTVPMERGMSVRQRGPKDGSVRIRRHLVCDDGRINRVVLRRYLLALGNCEVDEAENGQDAVDKAAVNGYDVIWMDIKMPVLDGIEATKQIKSNPKCNGVTIIGVTGDVTVQEISLYRDIGMQDILSKPVTKAVISGKLASLDVVVR
eukprot:Opistho-2@13938